MAMRCSEFLELYSDYRDGLIDDEETEARILLHLEDCLRCMGYDALVARGVIALRATSDVQPSRRLRRSLTQRFAVVAPAADEQHVRSTPAGVMAGLMVAGVLMLFGWAGDTILERSPERADAPDPRPARSVVVVANPGVPFVSFRDLSLPAFSESAVVRQRPISFGTWVNLSR